MIRSIQPNELGWLVSLANEFSQQYMNKPVDYTTISRNMRHLIDTGVALRSDNGAIVGMFMDDPYYTERHLVELGWFATDNSGVRLLNAFQQVGRDNKVDSIRLTTLQNSPAAASYVLGRKGYKPLEQSWELRLGDT
jgi:hypothetical protein